MRQTGITVTRLEQEVPDDVDGHDLRRRRRGARRARGCCSRATTTPAIASPSKASDAALRELDRLHHALDAADAWEMQTRVDTVLSHLGLDADAPFAARVGRTEAPDAARARARARSPTCCCSTSRRTISTSTRSSGWRSSSSTAARRCCSSRTIARFCAASRRASSSSIAAGSSTGARDYDTYLERKEAALAAEAREWAEFDKKLAKEEVWIRTGIQARRTRNEGRVRALEALRVERGARRERTGTVKLQAQEAERSGRLVVEARGRELRARRRAIVRDFTHDDHARRSRRPDRPERLRQDDAAPPPARRARAGRGNGPARHRTRDRVLRSAARAARSRAQRVRQHRRRRGLRRGRRRRASTCIGYLQDFLFPPDRARTPVRALSGGERNRLLLARLFTRSFNLLVLDEPTNDLDIETLDLLEELLLEFSGTLLLVSHDRAFLDNVVTSTLVLEGGGRSRRVRRRLHGLGAPARSRPSPAPPPKRAARRRRQRRAKPKKRKLSFKETRELAALPDRIDALEREREQLYASLADPALLRDGAAVVAAKARLAALEVGDRGADRALGGAGDDRGARRDRHTALCVQRRKPRVRSVRPRCITPRRRRLVRRPPLPRPLLGPGARAFHLGQPERQLSGGLRPLRGVLGQAGQHQVVERRGDRPVRPGRRRRRAASGRAA